MVEGRSPPSSKFNQTQPTMEKIVFSRQSYLGRSYAHFYGSYPDTTCTMFWLSLLLIVMYPFYLIGLAFKWSIPNWARKPVRFRDPELGALPIAVITFSASIAVLMPSIGLPMDLLWILKSAGIVSVVTYLGLLGVFTIDKLFFLAERWTNNRRSIKYESPRPAGSVRIFFSAMYSTLHRLCKPIEWK